MVSREPYRGREQTYIKHYFLEKYLEKVAFNVCSFAPEFVYIDGFSGPWKSIDEKFEDTSFMIALKKLRYVREGLKSKNPNLKIRCLFIEKDPDAFNELENKTKQINDIEIKTINGEFEDSISEIIQFIDGSFSLVFIDPTGWTGYGLQKIEPILRLPGEVIINFMFDHISRFVGTLSDGLRRSFDELGGDGFCEEIETLFDEYCPREETILNAYKNRLEVTGNFSYVTSTRVLKSNQDRIYFHLVYGTKHPKGLLEFREIERNLFEEQNSVRQSIQRMQAIESTGQGELFGSETFSESNLLVYHRASQFRLAEKHLDDLVPKSSSILYDKVLYSLLQNEFVWKKDVNDILKNLCKKGKIKLLGLGSREKTPKINCGHQIIRI